MSEKEQLLVEPYPAAVELIGCGLWVLNGARERLHETLATIDPAMLDWRPDETANSVGSLLYHIAAIEADWLFVEVLERPFSPQIKALLPDAVRDKNGRLTHVPNQTLAQHLNRLQTVRQTLLNSFAIMSLADFRRLRVLEQYDVTPEWVLFHLTQHETEHRGHIQEMIRQHQQTIQLSNKEHANI